MTATPQYVTEAGLDPLAARAIDHVWMHFTVCPATPMAMSR
jgi:hypothetical protein